MVARSKTFVAPKGAPAPVEALDLCVSETVPSVDGAAVQAPAKLGPLTHPEFLISAVTGGHCPCRGHCSRFDPPGVGAAGLRL